MYREELFVNIQTGGNGLCFKAFDEFVFSNAYPIQGFYLNFNPMDFRTDHGVGMMSDTGLIFAVVCSKCQPRAKPVELFQDGDYVYYEKEIQNFLFLFVYSKKIR